VTDPEQERRRADWFELFFDLVFVVMIAVLAHGLHGDPGWRDFGTFAVLFFPAWWAWVNLMVSVNLFGSTPGWNRIVLVASMPGLGLMAAAAPAVDWHRSITTDLQPALRRTPRGAVPATTR
jgi:low temperature requirement protein LtrA